MTGWPADDVTLAHGEHAVRLRPSLRAAVHLERLHDGFEGLFRKLSEVDTRTVRAVITQAATDPRDAQGFGSSLGDKPLRELAALAQGPLLALCMGLIPTPEETDAASSTPTSTDTPTGWPETFRKLFGYGTGWLGWTPAETWAATPQEIVDAFAAHTGKLKAIHGTPDDGDAATPADPSDVAQVIAQGADPTFDRMGLHALASLRSVRE